MSIWVPIGNLSPEHERQKGLTNTTLVVPDCVSSCGHTQNYIMGMSRLGTLLSSLVGRYPSLSGQRGAVGLVGQVLEAFVGVPGRQWPPTGPSGCCVGCFRCYGRRFRGRGFSFGSTGALRPRRSPRDACSRPTDCRRLDSSPSICASTRTPSRARVYGELDRVALLGRPAQGQGAVHRRRPRSSPRQVQELPAPRSTSSGS